MVASPRERARRLTIAGLAGGDLPRLYPPGDAGAGSRRGGGPGHRRLRRLGRCLVERTEGKTPLGRAGQGSDKLAPCCSAAGAAGCRRRLAASAGEARALRRCLQTTSQRSKADKPPCTRVLDGIPPRATEAVRVLWGDAAAPKSDLSNSPPWPVRLGATSSPARLTVGARRARTAWPRGRCAAIVWDELKAC